MTLGMRETGMDGQYTCGIYSPARPERQVCCWRTLDVTGIASSRRHEADLRDGHVGRALRRALPAHEVRRRLVQHHVAALEIVVAKAQPVRVPRRQRRLQSVHLGSSLTCLPRFAADEVWSQHRCSRLRNMVECVEALIL